MTSRILPNIRRCDSGFIAEVDELIAVCHGTETMRGHNHAELA